MEELSGLVLRTLEKDEDGGSPRGFGAMEVSVVTKELTRLLCGD